LLVATPQGRDLLDRDAALTAPPGGVDADRQPFSWTRTVKSEAAPGIGDDFRSIAP
jgi:hypothetical protein